MTRVRHPPAGSDSAPAGARARRGRLPSNRSVSRRTPPSPDSARCQSARGSPRAAHSKTTGRPLATTGRTGRARAGLGSAPPSSQESVARPGRGSACSLDPPRKAQRQNPSAAVDHLAGARPRPPGEHRPLRTAPAELRRDADPVAGRRLDRGDLDQRRERVDRLTDERAGDRRGRRPRRRTIPRDHGLSAFAAGPEPDAPGPGLARQVPAPRP